MGDKMNKKQKLWCIEILKQAYASKLLTGVPAIPVAAQATMETGYGDKEPIDVNSDKRSYNLFGVKADPNRGLVGNNGYVLDWTHEEIDGIKKPKLCYFKAYKTHKDSFNDHAKVLKLEMYEKAFNYLDDHEKFIIEIAKGGYATDSDYAKNMIPLMRQLNKIPIKLLKL